MSPSSDVPVGMRTNVARFTQSGAPNNLALWFANGFGLSLLGPHENPNVPTVGADETRLEVALLTPPGHALANSPVLNYQTAEDIALLIAQVRVGDLGVFEEIDREYREATA